MVDLSAAYAESLPDSKTSLEDWRDRLTADSPLWTSDEATGDRRADGERRRSSWLLVASLRESARALALAPLPDDADICLAEAEDLLFARDRITCALADRVGRVHGAGQAKQHGHASTRSWLRTAAGMSVAGAGRLLTLAVELARLPRVREKFAAGELAAGVVEAICMATAQLSDEHAGLAEPILLELAGKAGAAEVAKAGRYLRAVLDPDGEDRDERAHYGRRFLRVRPTPGGGLEGEFHLPREAAARLRALLDAYAQPRAEGDDRPLRVRQADAFIALLEQKIAAELLVLVNAESLPTGPEPAAPQPTGPQPTGPQPTDPGPDHPADANDTDPGTTEAKADAVADAEAEADAGSDATAAPPHMARPDPPPEDPPGHHAHGHRSAGDCRHGQATPEEAADGQGACGCSGEPGWSSGEMPGTPPGTASETRLGTAQGASLGSLQGAPLGSVLGTVLGRAPGLLLATGQVLPVSSVHRLARTSTLVRLVMDADGQVLDMGRKVRLATPAQRKAVFVRYATCWIDGCPLPATMCQIDHADNWSTGGLTDLKLLGPACQFHNRDRYRHPHRYTRHKAGTDRWTFTYHPAHTRRLRI